MTFLRWSFKLALVLTGCLIVSSQAAWGQSTPQVAGAWQRVYEQLPNFPKENQYVSQQTGSVKTSNTLANRLIQYHVFVKNRLASSRLDWKLTVSDYLGLNEVMFESRYPGVNELKTSPFERDRKIIQQLSRQQRDELVLAIVKAFTPASRSFNPLPTSSPEAIQKSVPNPSLRIPKSPKAGDANLLKP